jgi:hypothetical protein
MINVDFLGGIRREWVEEKLGVIVEKAGSNRLCRGMRGQCG